jgi:hypothetical protein
MEMVVDLDATWQEIPSTYEDEKGVVWGCFYTRVYNTDYLELHVIVNNPEGFVHSYKMNWDGERFTREGRGVFGRLPEITEWLEDNLPDPLEVAPQIGNLVYYRVVLRPDKWGEGEELGEFDGVDWWLAANLTTRGRFILYTQEKSLRRAAYYLIWNGERLSDTIYREELERYRPDLYDAVIERLEEITPPQAGMAKPTEILDRISI